MKKSIRNRIYWFLSRLVESKLRVNGHRVTAQFLDVLLTLFVNGFRWNDNSTRIERSMLKVERRKYLKKKLEANCA